MSKIKGTLLRSDARATVQNWHKRIDVALLVLQDADRIAPNSICKQKLDQVVRQLEKLQG